MRFKVPEKLERFFTTPKRFKIMVGGRGSGKSTATANAMLFKSTTESAKVACLREYQNSIEDSVLSLLSKQIKDLQIPGFKILKTEIAGRNGAAFKFKGLKKIISNIKGLDQFKYFWIEEGQFLTEETMQVLFPTLREEGSEIWITANIMSSADPFSKRFINPHIHDLLSKGFYEDDTHLIVFINYYDNPFFPEVLEKQRQSDQLLLDKAMYEHIWLGKFNDHIDNNIITAEMFDACIDAHRKKGFKASGAIITAYDPADSGDDQAVVIRHGSVITDLALFKDGDVNVGCDWALKKALEARSDVFIWDADGLGLSLKRQIAQELEGKQIIIQEFHGGGKVEHPDESYINVKPALNIRSKTNKENFFNLRSQRYWGMRDRVYNTYRVITHNDYIDPDYLISFPAELNNLEQFRSELCRIPRIPNAAGKIQLMQKSMMKRLYRLQSPNLADSSIMTLIPDVVQLQQNISYGTQTFDYELQRISIDGI